MPDGPRLPRLRSGLEALPRYKAGRAPAAPPDGLTPFKVASNELPFGPLPGVLAAAAEAIARAERYPDFAATALTNALADELQTSPDRIALGTGSVAVLQHVLQTVCDDGDEVVFAWRSFEAYPIVTRVVGATPIPVPLTAAHEHDIDAMMAAITSRTRALLLCSPNNPTGTLIDAGVIESALQRIPDDVLVVLDEAYIEFVDPERRPDVARLLEQHANLVVLRTFSKAYGLAGLRVGYAWTSERTADAVRAVATPFGVSAVAQAAALASLAGPARSDLEARVASVVRDREHLESALRAAGLPVVEGNGNFVWLPIGPDAARVGQACEEQALSVRVFDGEGVRVTAGHPEATQRLIHVLTNALG